MQSPKSSLEAFGLTEKEAAVYAAALELGAATADQLANQSGIKRSTTYLQIEQLQEKGLMSTFEQGKKTLFTPESPENLERLLERQKKDIELKQDFLKKELPQLAQLFEGAGERPVVRFFPGKDGVLSVREEVLKAGKKKMSVIFSPGMLVSLFGEDYVNEYSKRRTELKIHSRAIYSQGEIINNDVLDGLTERRVLQKDSLPFTIDIYLFDDKVGILSLKGNIFGLVIHSSQISESMQSVFEILWLTAGK
ncbi:MAG: hypothetical protein RLZZ480_892 [Candidatus Parcubacteria bacterium]|jgi:sugar-specific transcriptional regulator TrmB